MNLVEPDADPGDPARLAREAGRTADRLRSLSSVRLAARLPDGSTRAGASFALAQQLADLAAGLAGRSPRPLPELPDLAAGDVLAVCAHDLVEALTALLATGTQDDRALVQEECRTAVSALRQLRRQL